MALATPAPLGNASPVWRRAWHPVAHAEEVTADAPTLVRLTGEDWVVARFDGQLAAFADQCPHRLAPLSAGKLTQGPDGSARLACGYHGWQYDAAGRCGLIPSLGREGNISKRARLRPAFGVTEAYGLVWLAPQQPLSPLPAFPEWDEPETTRPPRHASIIGCSAQPRDARHRVFHEYRFGVRSRSRGAATSKSDHSPRWPWQSTA